MKRRDFLKSSSVVAGIPLVSPSLATSTIQQFNISKSQSDFVVVGAGVFGVWTAFYLNQSGAKVTLLDAYGPGNTRSSSGGETRIMRVDYGSRLMYTQLGLRAFDLWEHWQKEWNYNMMYSSGRLVLGNDTYTEIAKRAHDRLIKFGVESEVLSQEEMQYRWPQLGYEGIEAGLYYSGGPGGSALMAREACRITKEKFVENGGVFKISNSLPGRISKGKMENLIDADNSKITGGKYIFACGPWMGKMFPEILKDQLKVFRRDVLFIGSAAGDNRYAYPNLPIWSFRNLNYYGVPDMHGRGLKIAPFPDHNSIDMDKDDRFISNHEIKRSHEFVSERFPGLKGQPITGTRVCQLTMKNDENFIIDNHPDASNTWFACAGSGHAFKHGPAIGEYVSNRLLGKDVPQEYNKAFKLAP